MSLWSMTSVMYVLGALMMGIALINRYGMNNLVEGSLEYEVQNCIVIYALLCGAMFFLLGLHFNNVDRIMDLKEKVESLEGENGED